MLCAIAAMATVSCSKEIQNEQPVQETKLFPMTITATSTDTKTALVDRVSIKWLSTDRLSVFDGKGNHEFKSNGAGKTVTFSGDAAGAETYYALYPYNAEANLTGTTVTTTLASEQQAKAGSFADGLNINASKAAATDDFHFTNVLSVAKISVASTNLGEHTIKSVKLSSNNHALAGDVVVSFGETITAAAGTNAVKEITLEGGESGLSDGDYYFCLLPNAGGDITLTFTDTEGNVATKTATLKNAFTAGSIKNLGTVKGLVWTAPKYYVKVTSNADLTDGDYLIVYEEGSVAFNGGLETLDAASNTIEVTLDNNKIKSTDAVDAAKFTIDASAGTIKSASGYYIGQTSDANGMASSTRTAYENNISISDGDANIVSGGAYLRYNSASNQLRFRYYKSASYTGQQPIALYKLKDDRQAIATPTNLQVSDMTLSWDAVSNAANYSVKIGDVNATVEGTRYTFEGEADYYNVSVVANPSDVTTNKPSAAATLTDAKFGTPTLKTPVLSAGAIDETSIQVIWEIDSRASEGYYAIISKDGDQVDNKTVTTGSVSFEGLTNGEEYVVSVNAIAVTGVKAYLASDAESITLSTKARTTIADVIAAGGQGTFAVTETTVLAVPNTSNAIVGDGTGNVLLFKSDHGLAVGDVITINGATTKHNGVVEFNNPTVEETGTTTVNHGNPITMTAQNLFEWAGDNSEVVFVQGIGVKVGRKVTVEGKDLYLNPNNNTRDGNVDVKGYLYGWSSSYSNFNFAWISVDANESIPSLRISPSALDWAANETDSKTITVTVNGDASGYNVSPTSDDNWNISDNGNGTITVSPKAANTSTEAAKTLTLTITHNDNSALSEQVECTQAKAGGSTTTTYTFTSKSWGDSTSSWTSGKDGNQMSNGRGVQITTGATGANATTKSLFNGVSQVVVTYSTNASNGAGSVSIQVGENTAHSKNVTKTGGTTDRTLTYDINPAETGNVKITVTCTTNSIYIKSVAITHN